MKLFRLSALALSTVLLIHTIPCDAADDPLTDAGISYTESTETIDNPGAGYTSPIWLSASPEDTPIFNPTGNLVLLLVDLGAYSSGSNGVTAEDGTYTKGVDYDLDEGFFTNLRATLDNCRRNGCIVALRFRYDDVGKLDPEPSSFDQVVKHLEQIRNDGLLEDYQDIIAFVESGVVGSWGEHWGGKYCSFEDKAKVLDLLLDIVPAPIPVTVRTPPTFTTWAGITEEDLETYTPEPGSDAARVCLYNDGYMGSDSDLGTYHNRERDTGWVGRQALTSYFGGEFSGNLEFTQQYETYLPQNAIPEMYKTHLSYINSNIYQLYKDYTFGEAYDVEGVDNSAYYGETVYKFMRDHIGYRFVVRDCDLHRQAAQGGVLSIEMDIENTGFANPIMEQKAEILLEKDGNYIRTEVDVNTREWYSCTTVSPTFDLQLPSGLETGEWNVYFKLSTGNNTLDEMHLRSVKFANDNLWNSALGANYIGTFTVTESTSPAYAGNSFFQINAAHEVASGGEMFTVNGICAADGFTTTPSERDEALLCAEENGSRLYLLNDDKYLYVMAEIPYEAGAPVYNLSFTNQATGKDYWIYYQGNGFIYFNQNMPPYGVVQKHRGNTIEFRLPFGDMLGIEAGVTLNNIRVNIQDESASWVSVGSVKAAEYVVADAFNIYSAMQMVSLNKGDTHTMTAYTTAEGLTYQWLHDGREISGATGASYTLTADDDSAGVYSVTITSAGGTQRTAEICTANLSGRVRGDVNADGTFSVSDIIMLQKWLLCAGEITDRQAGDLCEDGIMDGFDLAVMKRMLLTE